MFNGIFCNPEYYYVKPYQVIFLRPDAEKPTYEQGIVFKTTVIAARDGAVFSTREILKHARRLCIKEDYAIVEGFEWVSFTID